VEVFGFSDNFQQDWDAISTLKTPGKHHACMSLKFLPSIFTIHHIQQRLYGVAKSVQPFSV
jgi:hypothetical protein